METTTRLCSHLGAVSRLEQYNAGTLKSFASDRLIKYAVLLRLFESYFVFLLRNDRVEHMGKRVLLIAMVIAAITEGILLSVSNPTTAGPIGVLAIFVLTYITVLGSISFVLYGTSRVIAKIFKTMTITRKPIQALSFRKAYYYASVVALGPVMLLGMQSVSGIGVYEFFLVCFFVIVGCLYVSRRMA